MSFEIGQGVLDPGMLIDCILNGAAEDLSDCTAFSLHWTKPDGTTTDIALTAFDLPNGTLSRTWVAGDTDIAGTHHGQVIVTRGDGKQEMFPTDETHVVWFVMPRLVAPA